VHERLGDVRSWRDLGYPEGPGQGAYTAAGVNGRLNFFIGDFATSFAVLGLVLKPSHMAWAPLLVEYRCGTRWPLLYDGKLR
jgi:hypothetical protein